MPTITSLHIEIARLRHENERPRAQLDALLAPSEHGHTCDSAAGMHPTVVRVFIDKRDWDHEVGVVADGNTVFPSINALKEHSGHDLAEHGVVEVRRDLHECCEAGWRRA